MQALVKSLWRRLAHDTEVRFVRLGAIMETLRRIIGFCREWFTGRCETCGAQSGTNKSCKTCMDFKTLSQPW
jgi:hypothetical protein